MTGTSARLCCMNVLWLNSTGCVHELSGEPSCTELNVATVQVRTVATSRWVFLQGLDLSLHSHLWSDWCCWRGKTVSNSNLHPASSLSLIFSYIARAFFLQARGYCYTKLERKQVTSTTTSYVSFLLLYAFLNSDYPSLLTFKDWCRFLHAVASAFIPFSKALLSACCHVKRSQELSDWRLLSIWWQVHVEYHTGVVKTEMHGSEVIPAGFDPGPAIY